MIIVYASEIMMVGEQNYITGSSLDGVQIFISLSGRIDYAGKFGYILID